MAFSTEASGSSEVMSEINMTPLVDVMLVLLIIFIVTLPVIQHSVVVQLPKERTQRHADRDEDVRVIVTAQGQWQWSGETLSRSELQARMDQAAQSDVPPRILIQADESARYEAVAAVMGAAQRAGLRQVGFATRPGVQP